MKKQFELRLSGSGGQGLILSAIILGSAAAETGQYVAQSQSYGPEARGGASRAEIVISENPIDYPLVEKPDIFLALTKEAYEKHVVAIKDETVVIIDDSINSNRSPKNLFSLPIINKAKTEINNTITANMISIGIISAISGFFDDDIIEQYIRKRVPQKNVDANIKAFNLGKRMIEYVRK